MYRILPADLTDSGPLVARQPRRGLSRRRVKRLVRPNQHWHDADGTPWRVAAVYRKDGLVRLERSWRGWTLDGRIVPFAELGAHYQLEGGGS